ncbi:MAG: type II toxin-antitoxin system PemK/MazF family toxin [Planctomycetota bacterium]
MGRFVKGDVVVVPFPFTDLSEAKRRPAFVVASLPGEDCILCQITSQQVRDAAAIALLDEDFEQGGLRQPSRIRPNRLFTANARLILYTAGRATRAKTTEVIESIVKLLRSG